MSNPRLISQLPSHHSVFVAHLSAQDAKQNPPTVHPHASLAYYLHGTATVWCGATYSLEPGDVLLIPEGMPHYLISANEVEILGLSLCTSCMTSESGHYLSTMFHAVSEGAGAARTIAPHSREQMRQLLLSLRDELVSGAPWQELAVEGYLLLLSSILLRADCALKGMGDAATGASLSARALSFITRNATDGISLVEVAQHVNRSVAHTAAVVKAETGRTVVQWITHARLAAARQLLLRTDDTVESIAARISFASPSQFHRVFKRLHGTTPTAWRRAHSATIASS